jgi:hypothetical protein
MKRLNPETGLPFKRGQTKDNRIFWSYDLSKIDKLGYFKENWCTKLALEKRIISHRKSVKIYSKAQQNKALQLIKGAKQRGKVSITVDWVSTKIENGYCELSGLPFVLKNSTKFSKNPYAPSLDRIDSNNKEYSINNTRLVLACVNQALNQYGLEHFLKVATAVIDKQKEN